jgi:TPR repeat protein
MYQDWGRGDESAFRLLIKAAEQGHYRSACEVGRCYEHGQFGYLDGEFVLEMNKEEALKWYRLALELAGENYIEGDPWLVPWFDKVKNSIASIEEELAGE